MSDDDKDLDFATVETPSYTWAATTPEVADDFRGFRIAGPREIEAYPRMRFPISAVARFGAEAARLPGKLWDSVSVVVVEVNANRCWVGTLLSPYRTPISPPADEPAEAGAPAPAKPKAEDDVPDVEVGGVSSVCANVDLCELLDLPPVPGRYDVHLTFGSLQSNSVRVNVIPPRDEED